MDDFQMVFHNFPKGQYQQKRATTFRGKPRFYESGALKEARSKYMQFFLKQAEEAPWSLPLKGPVRIKLLFSFPATRKSQVGPKTSRPDCDNLAKLVLDCLQRSGWITDDAQVAHLIIRKEYSLEGRRLLIHIKEMERTNG